MTDEVEQLVVRAAERDLANAVERGPAAVLALLLRGRVFGGAPSLIEGEARDIITILAAVGFPVMTRDDLAKIVELSVQSARKLLEQEQLERSEQGGSNISPIADDDGGPA